MRAMYYEAFEAQPEIPVLPDPTPTPGGVVIKVEATGLCRSDWHGWMGHDPDIRLPHVPGHELAGKVVAVGKAVRRFREGERVTVPFVSGCGHCGECRSGNQQVCEEQFQPGFTHWGSFAEYVAIVHADHNLVHLPEAKLVHVHGAATKRVVPLATRIEYHRSLYHFYAKRRGSGAAAAVAAIRVVKLVLALLLLAPVALLSERERERWRQRAWILAWHVAGRPVEWGLSGVRVRAEGSA